MYISVIITIWTYKEVYTKKMSRANRLQCHVRWALHFFNSTKFLL